MSFPDLRDQSHDARDSSVAFAPSTTKPVRDRTLISILALVAFASLVLALMLGYFAGKHLAGDVYLLVIFHPLLFGVVFLGSELFETRNKVLPPGKKRLLVAALLVYFVVLFLWDPFLFMYGDKDILWAAILLTPFVAAFVYLFCRRGYYAASGLWLILFATFAIIGYNVNHGLSGIGYFTRWLG